jgi:hypothetical protein
MTESRVANEWIGRGELRNQKSNLLELLTGRFPGAVPTEVVQSIEHQDSFGLLRDWFKAAVRASTFEEFLAVLKR